MGAINDANLLELADAIGLDNVTRLGVNLGFTLTETNRYKASNHFGGSVTSQGTLRMLQDWRNNVISASQTQILKAAMQRADLGGIAEKFFGPVTEKRSTDPSEPISSESEEESYSPEVVQIGSKITLDGTGPMENVNVAGQKISVGSSSETSTPGSSQPPTVARKRVGKGGSSGSKIKQQGSTITFTNTGPITSLNIVGQETNVDSSKSVSQTASRSETASTGKRGTTEGGEDTGPSNNPQTQQQLSDSVKIFAVAPLIAFIAYFIYFWLI